MGYPCGPDGLKGRVGREINLTDAELLEIIKIRTYRFINEPYTKIIGIGLITSFMVRFFFVNFI